MTLNSWFTNVIRTAVPGAVGAVLAWLATRGLHLNPALVLPYAIPAVMTAYYAGVHALEAKWPKLGYILGWPAPTFGAPPPEAQIAPPPQYGIPDAPLPPEGWQPQDVPPQ